MTDAEDEVLGKAYDGRLMRRFLGYLRPYWPLVLLSLAFIFVRIGADLAGPLIVRDAVDGPVARKEYEGLVFYAVLFLGAITVMAIFEYVETIVTNLVGQRVIRDIRMQMFGHLQRVPVSYYDHTSVGRLVVRTTNDVENLNELFTSGLIAFFSDLFLLAGVIVMMFVLDARLALVTMATAPVILALTLVFRGRARDRYREMRKRIARLNGYLNESIQGMRTVQMFGQERRCADQFRDRNEGFRDSAVAAVLVYSVFYPGVELLSSVAVALLVWYGGISILSGTLTFGSFIAFWYCAQKFFQPVRDLSEKYNILQSAMASSERIFKILDEPVAPAGELSAPPLEGSIRFENVTFSYDGKGNVLEDVSFEIRPGQRVAVVGLTGAGKTTLINLLLRFYEVTKGRILIDGRDLREYDPRSLRRQTGLVLQDVFLFAGTAEENLRLGASLPRERVEAAAKTVHADGFLSRLPKGLDSEIAERGASLSAGERQLLSFARALAFDPRILVLDEATSNIDRETEQLIQDALERLLAGRTSLVIAHRLSTIQTADQILVLHHGKVREQGTHAELMKTDGLYRKLCRLQAGEGRTQNPETRTQNPEPQAT